MYYIYCRAKYSEIFNCIFSNQITCIYCVMFSGLMRKLLGCTVKGRYMVVLVFNKIRYTVTKSANSRNHN